MVAEDCPLQCLRIPCCSLMVECHHLPRDCLLRLSMLAHPTLRRLLSHLHLHHVLIHPSMAVKLGDRNLLRPSTTCHHLLRGLLLVLRVVDGATRPLLHLHLLRELTFLNTCLPRVSVVPHRVRENANTQMTCLLLEEQLQRRSFSLVVRLLTRCLRLSDDSTPIPCLLRPDVRHRVYLRLSRSCCRLRLTMYARLHHQVLFRLVLYLLGFLNRDLLMLPSILMGLLPLLTILPHPHLLV